MATSTDFDQTKAYAQQEDVYFNDGREKKLLEYVVSLPHLEEVKGSPSAVLAAIDEFGRNEKYLMNVGESKGSIITNLISQKKPEIMVELGGYVGYSAILFGNAAREAGGQGYLCLESNAEFANIAAALIEIAGLSSFVKIIVAPSSDAIRKLHSTGRLAHIDFLFLDHYKPAYLPDLKLCEQLGLIHVGTTIAADNVIKPGNPPYLAYVRSDVDEKKRELIARLPQGDNSNETDGINGNPDLVYESQLIHSFEPTGIPDGVEITHCVGRGTHRGPDF